MCLEISFLVMFVDLIVFTTHLNDFFCLRHWNTIVFIDSNTVGPSLKCNEMCPFKRGSLSWGCNLLVFYYLVYTFHDFEFYGKQLHDRIILLRREFWAHKIIVTPPLFIEVPVPSQESDWSCICVLGIHFISFYDFEFGSFLLFIICLVMWYFCHPLNIS